MKYLKLFFVSIVTVLLLLFIALLTYIFVEPKAYDFMIKNVSVEKLGFDKTKSIYGHNDVVLIIIDDESIKKYRWPWKRDLHTKILKYFIIFLNF